MARVYGVYQQLLHKFRALDFDDLLTETVRLLHTQLEILDKLQEQFKYILVDEFQDTNFAQFQLLKLLASRHKNISVVSDDDQCMFRYRGAAYSNILNFIKEYADAKQISLIQNYRSTQSILDFAFEVISKNQTHLL